MKGLKYYGELIIQPNSEAHIAILCGWTKREKVAAMLSQDSLQKVAAIGQLYSREGANYVVRNIFLQPQITHLIITGLDMSGSIEFFKNFLEGDIQEDVFHKEIPKESLRRFIGWFSQHYSAIALNDLEKEINLIGSQTRGGAWISAVRDFPDPSYLEASNFPSEGVGMRIEGSKVADLWLKVLDRILKFGRDKKSQYGDMQRELVSLVTVVSDEDSNDPFLPGFLTFGKAEFDKYLEQIMTEVIPSGLEYTYGSRLRNHNGINQIQSMIEQIKKEDYTRRAVAVTWSVSTDDNNPKSPCLVIIQGLVSEGKFFLTCYIRSNDMYGAWPQNALALRSIQQEIACATGKEMGKLTIISGSAHIYERDYEKAIVAVKENKLSLECVHDPRGNFSISIDGPKINVAHMSPIGTVLQRFDGFSAREIMEKICPFVSDVLHAMYLGSELRRAEDALIGRTVYEQE